MARVRKGRQLTSVEIEQARVLKSVMTWAALAKLYRMNRSTLMYQIMPEEWREEKRARMRETNREAYWRAKAQGKLRSRRRAYQEKFGLAWEDIAAVRDAVKERVSNQNQGRTR